MNMRVWSALVCCVFLLPARTAVGASPFADTSGAIQTQDTNRPGVVADVTEAKRGEGVLTIKVRFRNTGTQEINYHVIDSRNHEKFYVTAANKKYFVLKDGDGQYLMPSEDGGGNLYVKLAPGQSYTWWAKFPAPPVDVKKVTLITPLAPPFEDVPLTEK